jgi:outer membrane protein OmpA-like peptidoglycan-associated protein
MRPSPSRFLAGTILSGLLAATLVPSAHAQTSQGYLLAQAGPANQPEEPKKKPPAKPQPPKPPAPAVTPHPPQTPAPQASRPPAAGAPTRQVPERKPAPRMQPAQTTPPPTSPRPPAEPARKPAPKMQPAQTTPAQHPSGKPGPSAPERRATPEVPGKLKPGEHPAASAPSPQTAPQAVSPHERGKPAAATPSPAPSVVRRAPPPPGNPTAVPPPTQVINKGQFLAPKGQTPTAGINQVRSERREEHVGNQLIIREPDRTIVQEGNRTFIRHSEVDRFVVGARNVQVEHRGNETVTIVVRPDNVQIIDYSDSDGRLLRRVRRGPDGREIVIIDNGFAGAQLADVFLSLTAPVIRIPRDRYIVDADRADEAAIYGVLVAPPIERIDRRYTLDQVRYNEPLRAYMPRLDLEVNFDTGSWQLTPDQVDRLSAIAEALNRAIQRDPREVFLIEGYTDAVGSDVDNLSLSDRRAESVAVALTEQFQVPAENLATQGYGKQFLKVPTGGPERANRRVAIRRITPLVDPDAVSQR